VTTTGDLGAGDYIDEHGELQHREYDPVSRCWLSRPVDDVEPEQPDTREEAPDKETI
jgi:hypothetical protein